MLVRGHGDWSAAYPGRCYPLDRDRPGLIGSHPGDPIRASMWAPFGYHWRVFEDSGRWYVQCDDGSSRQRWGAARPVESDGSIELAWGENFGSTFYLVDGTAESGSLDGAYRRLVRTHGLFLDPATGVFHRAYLRFAMWERFQSIRLHGGSFWGLLIDIDEFKRLNERHGFAVGDAILGDVAATLSRRTYEHHLASHQTLSGHALSSAHPGDLPPDPVRPAAGQTPFCGRHGGEELLVLLGGVSRDQAVAKAEAIRRDVAAVTREVDGIELHVTVSVGVVEWREPWSYGDWLRRLDNAMYAAKVAGRDQVLVGGE